MWLLAGVRLLRALRMSHRFTFFTLPTACAVSYWVGLFPLLVLCCFGCVWFLFCFACAAGFLFDYSCGCIQMTDHASSLVRLC